MKKIWLISLVVIVAKISNAQMPSYQIMEDYKALVARLEPSPSGDEKPFYLHAWKADSLIYLRNEICLYKLGIVWTDTPSLMKKDSLLFLRIKSFPNYKIQVSAKFGQKKPAKSRQHYEEKRLLVITEEFGKALSAGDKATMDSILFLMSYYYQEPCFLVAKETKEEYQKTFIAIRQQYSNFLFECYKEKKCTQKDINRLFGFCINAYPDANMARGVIDYVYTNEKNYLFSTGKASAVQFEIAATYFLSVLITYNHKEIKDISSRNDLIMRGYSKLFELPVSQYYRDLYKRNLKRYLAEKYEVYPPE